jgi:predicted secreted Zn-dependent protease
MAFNKATGNGGCRITSAKATFSANVGLPRLVADKAHKPQLLADWRAYLADIETIQAANFWFVHDRMGEVEKAIVASTCEGAQAAGNAALERLKAQAAEFQRANAAPAPAPAPAAK